MQSLNLIVRQAQHLCAMVDDLMDVREITRASWNYVKGVNLKTIIAGIGYPFTLLDEAVLIDGDPLRLVQLLSNLLDNAAKYTPEGGDISVAAEMAGNEVCIKVCDTGNRIPANRLESIFEVYSIERRCAGSFKRYWAWAVPGQNIG
jgi:signal transduction histidine kinase